MREIPIREKVCRRRRREAFVVLKECTV